MTHHYLNETTGGYEVIERAGPDDEEQVGWIPADAVDDVLPYLVVDRKIADVAMKAGPYEKSDELWGGEGELNFSIGIQGLVIRLNIDPIEPPEA